MSELNDNNDLAQRASFLLTRTCGVSPPRELISPFLNSLFQVIQESTVSFPPKNRGQYELTLCSRGESV
jgi:hypothetical protein